MLQCGYSGQQIGFCSNFLILGHSHLREGGEVAANGSEPGFQVSHMCRVRPVGKNKVEQETYISVILRCHVILYRAF